MNFRIDLPPPPPPDPRLVFLAYNEESLQVINNPLVSPIALTSGDVVIINFLSSAASLVPTPPRFDPPSFGTIPPVPISNTPVYFDVSGLTAPVNLSLGTDSSATAQAIISALKLSTNNPTSTVSVVFGAINGTGTPPGGPSVPFNVSFGNSSGTTAFITCENLCSGGGPGATNFLFPAGFLTGDQLLTGVSTGGRVNINISVTNFTSGSENILITWCSL